jgi:hypothetical protein
MMIRPIPPCHRHLLILSLLSMLWASDSARACNNIIVGRDASADGSVMLAPPPTPAREAPGNQSWKCNFLTIT